MRVMVCRRSALIAVLLVGVAWSADAAEPAALARARSRYNAADFDGAIAAATEARQQPQWADAATLVMARAYIERYRLGPSPMDLEAAREGLATVRSAALSARDRIDLLIGMGQALYYAELFGPSAELFETALGPSSIMSSPDRDALLEWWAMALDRDAYSRPVDRRLVVFARVTARMDEEIANNPASAVANYWLAAAARGAGDLERAWAAAIAGWVRASLATSRTETLRADLDRLVSEALIPERAKGRSVREQQTASAALRAEWELVKEHWR